MFRFTIRDALLVTAMLAALLAWWLEHEAHIGSSAYAKQLQKELSTAKRNEDSYLSKLRGEQVSCRMVFEIDWKLADRPIP
jgi:hypothetical protein